MDPEPTFPCSFCQKNNLSNFSNLQDLAANLSIFDQRVFLLALFLFFLALSAAFASVFACFLVWLAVSCSLHCLVLLFFFSGSFFAFPCHAVLAVSIVSEPLNLNKPKNPNSNQPKLLFCFCFPFCSFLLSSFVCFSAKTFFIFQLEKARTTACLGRQQSFRWTLLDLKALWFFFLRFLLFSCTFKPNPNCQHTLNPDPKPRNPTLQLTDSLH